MVENNKVADGVGERTPLHGPWDDMGSSIYNLLRISLSFVSGNQVKNSLLLSSECVWSFEMYSWEKKLNRYAYTRMQSMGITN